MSKQNIVVHPTPFPSIGQMIAIWNAKQITFEIHDHFEKQTYRNRYYILGAHGKHLLSIPVKHSKSRQHIPTEKMLIANEFPWQKQHWKSIQTAYRSSPYFEYYEDRIEPLFEENFEKLMDFNIKSIRLIFELLNKPFNYIFTDEYQKEKQADSDLRYLVDAKTEFDYIKQLEPYIQVFSDRHEFIPDLSVLDLLFMLGPETEMYLDRHKDLFF